VARTDCWLTCGCLRCAWFWRGVGCWKTMNLFGCMDGNDWLASEWAKSLGYLNWCLVTLNVTIKNLLGELFE